MKIMTEKKYIKLFKDLYKDIPESKQKKAMELIKRAAELSMILDECKAHITEEGSVTEMDQGKYTITRENPYSKVQDAKTKSLLSVLDRLDKMVPDSKSEGVAKAGEALAAFVAKGKPGVETR